MDIKMIFNEQVLNINFENICLILGENNQGKTYLMNELYDGLSGGKKDDFQINGLTIFKGDYYVVKIDEDETFESAFKFTKSNVFRKLMYDEVLEKTKDTIEQEMINNINNILEIINKEVNLHLNNNVYDNHLKLITQISSIDQIVEKFTSFYIKDTALNYKTMSKGENTEYLYKLYLSLIKQNHDNRVLIIDNIDANLVGKPLIEFLENLIEISESGIKVIITSNSPMLYKYLYNKATIYKIKNLKLKKIRSYNDIIKKTILMTEYENNKEVIAYNSFAEQNICLIKNDDINLIMEKYIYPNLLNIGLLYCYNDVSVIKKYNSNQIQMSIIYRDNIEKNLFKSIKDELNP